MIDWLIEMLVPGLLTSFGFLFLTGMYSIQTVVQTIFFPGEGMVYFLTFFFCLFLSLDQHRKYFC